MKHDVNLGRQSFLGRFDGLCVVILHVERGLRGWIFFSFLIKKTQSCLTFFGCGTLFEGHKHPFCVCFFTLLSAKEIDFPCPAGIYVYIYIYYLYHK